MYQYGIVAIGYKNVKGIKRLLDALSKADYGHEKIKLIISVDKSDSDVTLNIAKEFQWDFGEKYVITFEERLGLRNHILHCGDYLDVYDLDALAVFEDDTMPSRLFFQFMKAASEKYMDNENIAGVSLYSHKMNYNTKERFIPMENGADNYFMQCAQSWGQVWFRKQWSEFRAWYKEQENLESSHLIPEHVTGWPETSWLKYHIKYCVVKNKYFVYPYLSYSTCFLDVGEHVKVQTDDFQVPISNMCVQSRNFHLIDFDEEALKYNVFFENQILYRYCNVNKDELLIDLYGDCVATDKRYVLTKRTMPYCIIGSWENKLVPHEMNLICDLHGNAIFLYDLENEGKIVRFPQKDVRADQKRSKMEAYFDILDHWMEMEEQGKSLETYFLGRQWKHIGIYGYGKIGKHLYNRLKNTKIHVDYFIDRNNNLSDKFVEVKSLNDELPEVDGIIVTTVMDLEKIKKDLQQKGNCSIISVEDIFR